METSQLEIAQPDIYICLSGYAQISRAEILRSRLVRAAAYLAQYYTDGYKEEMMMEVGSTTSMGSAASHESLPDIRLGPRIASTVYFA